MIVKSPGVDARPLPAWGFYIRNVNSLQLDNVRLRYAKEDLRPALICSGVERLSLDDLEFQHSAEAEAPLVLDNVEQLAADQTDVSLAKPKFHSIELACQDDSGRFVAGGKYAVNVMVENGSEEGLACIDVCSVPVRASKETPYGVTTNKRWVWLRAGEKKNVVFAGLIAPEPGKYEVKAGDLSASLLVEERK